MTNSCRLRNVTSSRNAGRADNKPDFAAERIELLAEAGLQKCEWSCCRQACRARHRIECAGLEQTCEQRLDRLRHGERIAGIKLSRSRLDRSRQWILPTSHQTCHRSSNA